MEKFQTLSGVWQKGNEKTGLYNIFLDSGAFKNRCEIIIDHLDIPFHISN